MKKTKMRSRVAAYAVVPAVLGIGLLGTSIASASGIMGMGGFGGGLSSVQIADRQAAMFSREADLLGMNVDQVKDAWAQGKSFAELAKEKGLTKEQLQQKMHETQMTQMKSHMDALVASGVITRAQADQRLQIMQSKDWHSGQNKGDRGASRPSRWHHDED